MTELAQTIAELRRRLDVVRRAGPTIGLVPTMGALHAGHGRLIECARRQTGCVVVSIFVNPIQFNQQEDYDKYPRTLDGDLAFCAERGADLVFAPDAREMYPAGPPLTSVEVARVADHLCGAFRPGHFRGVATVVMKLFNIVQPERAYFGEKDAQQLAVIRRMVKDLDAPLEIVGVATVREPDGLALSSRNRRLSAQDRAAATVLYRALAEARDAIASGVCDPAAAKQRGLAVLEREPRARVEYFEIVDPDEMQPLARIDGPVLIAAAIWMGGVRLIDNIAASLP